jgi:hypothetical protein
MSEVEVAFIILSRDQNKAIVTIKDLILGEGYLVEEKGIIKINDTYFDTKDKSLEKEKIAFRVRITNETNAKVTLKIPKKSNRDYSERTEIEKPLSKDTLDEVMSTLNSRVNINIGKPGFDNNNNNYFSGDPKPSLLKLGFRMIQNRETYRNVINAVSKKSKQTEYEFAIDATTYITNGHRISNTEVEIESKNATNNDYSRLTNFIDTLKKHNELFQIWPHSKLATGKAIEELLDNNQLKECHDFDGNNILTHSGIEKITAHIKTKGM